MLNPNISNVSIEEIKSHSKSVCCLDCTLISIFYIFVNCNYLRERERVREREREGERERGKTNLYFHEVLHICV